MKKFKIQKTQNYVALQNMCDAVLKSCTMGLVHGKSGAGKTTAVKSFASKKKGIVYYRVSDATVSRKALLENILFAMGGVSLSKSLASLRRQIVKTCIGSNVKMLIIDDANYLASINFTILNGIREDAGISLLLVGTERLPQLITQGVRSLELEQVSSRIEFVQGAKDIDYNTVGVFLIGLGFPPPVQDDDKSFVFFQKIVKIAYDFACNNGQYRKIKNLFDRALQLKNLRKVDWSVDLFKDAKKYLV